MNEILNTKESAKAEQNWMSKKELMDICKCSDKTLEQIISSFNIETGFDIKKHMKKELMEICKCSDKTLEQIINDLNSQVNLAIQNHLGQACPD